MQFGLRSLFVVVLVSSLCVGVFPAAAYGNLFAENSMIVCSLLILSVTLTSPFSCEPASRPFWLGYSCAAGLFAVLANCGENFLFYTIRDSTAQIASWFEPGLLPFAPLRTAITMAVPFVAGLVAGVVTSICLPGAESTDDE